MSETPPAGYRKLPDGTRCRCIRLWQDGVGGFYCCRSSATLAFGDSLSQHCPNCEAQAVEIERLGSVIDATALHWLALQDKHHVPWEGAIDGAMAAACAEIEKLRNVVDALLQHEASTFFGPDADKHMRASWRGVIRKAKKTRANLGETK